MFGLFSKGKIDIKPEKYNFAPGESINGTVTVRLKMPTESGGLSIRLVADETRVQGFGTNRNCRTVKIFDFEQPLDGPKTYPAAPLEYKFRITIPSDAGEKQSEGVLGAAVKTLQMISQTRSRQRWTLVARLAVKGIDLRKKLHINVATQRVSSSSA